MNAHSLSILVLLRQRGALLSLSLGLVGLAVACADDTADDQGGGVSDAADLTDLDGTSDTADVPDVLDSSVNDMPSMCSGAELFGRPNETTGLSDEQCSPSCADCGPQGFEARVFDPAELDQLRAWRLAEPFPEVTDDPYVTGAPDIGPDSVCGFIADPGEPLTYRLQTFASSDEAIAAGAEVTHGGICGVCSTLENLAVYIQNEDLTAPVRQCGLDGISSGKDANIACLQELGFDLPCAQIWYFNTENTRNSCFEPCIAALNEPYHLPDGSLNECLQCDEDNSGPVFKAVAGRTRRNSGLANALCRPCSEVMPLVHSYADVMSAP